MQKIRIAMLSAMLLSICNAAIFATNRDNHEQQIAIDEQIVDVYLERTGMHDWQSATTEDLQTVILRTMRWDTFTTADKVKIEYKTRTLEAAQPLSEVGLSVGSAVDEDGNGGDTNVEFYCSIPVAVTIEGNASNSHVFEMSMSDDFFGELIAKMHQTTPFDWAIVQRYKFYFEATEYPPEAVHSRLQFIRALPVLSTYDYVLAGGYGVAFKQMFGGKSQIFPIDTIDPSYFASDAVNSVGEIRGEVCLEQVQFPDALQSESSQAHLLPRRSTISYWPDPSHFGSMPHDDIVLEIDVKLPPGITLIFSPPPSHPPSDRRLV